MDSEGKFWFALWSMVVASILLLFGGLAAFSYATTKMAMENGYEQKYIDGYRGPVWVKK